MKNIIVNEDNWDDIEISMEESEYSTLCFKLDQAGSTIRVAPRNLIDLIEALQKIKIDWFMSL